MTQTVSGQCSTRDPLYRTKKEGRLAKLYRKRVWWKVTRCGAVFFRTLSQQTPMNQIILLRQTLKPLLGWHGARLNFLARFLIALWRVKTINLSELAIGFRSNVKEGGAIAPDRCGATALDANASASLRLGLFTVDCYRHRFKSIWVFSILKVFVLYRANCYLIRLMSQNFTRD